MKLYTLIWFVFLSVWLLALPNLLRAGHLPTKSYTTFDGLANDEVSKIVRDSRGFLWFCTGEGLSRFDGFEFKNYTLSQGLPHPGVNDFLETNEGELLVATSGGLAIFNPNGRAYRWNILTSQLEQTADDPPMFQTFKPPNPADETRARIILSLAASADGRIFAGTGSALFQLQKTGDQWSFRKIESQSFKENTIFTALQFDTAGYLWIAASSGIYRLSPEGNVEIIDDEGGGAVLVDRQNQVWIGGGTTDAGLRVFTISAGGRTAQLKRTYRAADGLPQEHAMAGLIQTADGRILVLVGPTLCEFLPDAAENQSKFKIIARGNFQTVAEDDGGNLWLGTEQEGAWKLFPDGFVKYDASDGVPDAAITSILTDAAGEISFTSGSRQLLRFAGGRFESVVPNGLKSRSWGAGQLDFQDPNGAWWVASANGLMKYSKPARFSDLSSARPEKILTTADGLAADEIFNLFEDSRGDIWITTVKETETLHRFDRRTGLIHRYTTDDGLPKANGAVAFGEDAGGNVWLGFFSGRVARCKNGKFQIFSAADGLPNGSITSIFSDRAGRLWLATASRGVFRVDHPADDHPQFVSLSTAEGLSSNRATCVTEDDFGQIYIGTAHGINRVDPQTGNIKLYTQADGLPGNVVSLCGREKNGALWFASRHSLIKYVPQREAALKAPKVFIGALSVNGEPEKISGLGAENAGPLDLDSDRHQIRIDFFALGFGTGDRLRYQYKLNDQDWSAADEQKSVTFNLAPGDYQFAVRAVNADNFASEKPAVVSFSIAPPIYRRWWFLLLAGLFVTGILLTVERRRAARLRELKNAFGKLSASEQRFRRMIDQSSLGFVIFAADGSLRSVNQAYERFWNISFEQIKDWKMLEDEQLIETGVAENLRRVFAGESISLPPTAYDPQKNSAGVTVAATDETRWIQSFAYPVKSETDELLEVIMVMEDVTEFKNSEVRLQNAREERLRELEQVRRRIAADLHDDIGSSLTQISIFSEVLQQRIDKNNGRVLEPLEFIATSSRELVDSMSDIVWAINPKKDFLSELTGKMHRFAADVFTARNIAFTYSAVTPDEDLALGANFRREVFLIFKESVNNIVKHAKAGRVEIELIIEDSEIRLTLQDDGAGFDTEKNTDGHGLYNMKQRAAGLNGHLQIISDKSSGTKTSLTIPLAPGAEE